MSRIIQQRPWDYTLYDKEGEWILTLLIGGVVDVPVSISLTDEEISKIKEGGASVEDIVESVRKNRSFFSGREIRPAFRG